MKAAHSNKQPLFMTKSLTIPKRVLLRGFDDDGRAAASSWLGNFAIEVTNMPSLADLVVTGPEADASLLRKANLKGARVASWEEFQALVKVETATVSHDSQFDGDHLNSEFATLDAHLLQQGTQTPIERTDTFLRILDLKIPLPQTDPSQAWRVPTASQFTHLCLDRPFLETLRAVALGVAYRLPVALEGETAASKTSAVMYLAHLLGQPLVRLNLSGHTDASELVGRFVPADTSGMMDWGEITPETPWIKPDSRKIVAQAHKDGRPLSNAERMAVIGREQFPVSGWRFQEGYLPNAMRHGWWVLLDELNLAETQVLERLNCALENPPSLVLTEGAGTVFGQGGDVAVHPEFRMLSTMNPSDYAGRAIISQAFADRWGVWHQAAGPGEREIEQMLRFLVFGEHPRVVIAGRSYRAEPSLPVFAELQQIPEIGSLLNRLAVFHYGIFRAAGGGGSTPSIGRLKKERYSFSRRILLNLLSYIGSQIRAGSEPSSILIPEAIQVLYLARLRDEADRKAVRNILRAGGLL